MPRLPTYETSRRLFFQSSCSMVAFHCQVLGSCACRVIAETGAPLEVEQSKHATPGFAGSLSRVRMPLRLALKGGLPAGGRYGDTRSRWKNCPTPPRKTVLALPKISQAKPRRGAKVLKSVSRKERLSVTPPPRKPAPVHGLLSANIRPLQGSAPSRGSNNPGTNVAMRFAES